MLNAIESGELPAGASLRETELAKRFKISRIPVREVLRRLETQGPTTHKHNHGSVVATMNDTQMIELYLLREALEGVAARLAASHTAAAEVDLLYEMIEQDKLLIGRPLELSRDNRRFHARLRNAARNRYLSQILENLRLSLALLRGTIMSAPNRGAEAVAEHLAIIDHIAARRPNEAEEAARSHIRHALQVRRMIYGLVKSSNALFAD